MKDPEEMSFTELQKAGLLSFTAVRNWRMWKEFKELRAKGLKVYEAQEILAKKYHLSTQSIIYCIRYAHYRRRMAQ